MSRHAEIEQRARQAGIVPVLTVPEASQAVPLAKALVAGGLDVLEVTLRTDAALEVIRQIAESDVDCIIGAGTIVTDADIRDAEDAGAAFLVTPGTPQSLWPALAAYSGLVIPGSSSATEAMALLDAGYTLQKFFPAEPCGGASYLKGLGGPLPNISFMPTGGVRLETVQSYLALDNVAAVGGSWIAPAADIAAGHWDQIEMRAREAYKIANQISA